MSLLLTRRRFRQKKLSVLNELAGGIVCCMLSPSTRDCFAYIIVNQWMRERRDASSIHGGRWESSFKLNELSHLLQAFRGQIYWAKVSFLAPLISHVYYNLKTLTQQAYYHDRVENKHLFCSRLYFRSATSSLDRRLNGYGVFYHTN